MATLAAAVIIARFAPSPTGPLHLGHVYSAWWSRRRAQVAGGHCLLRIEDIDAARCRAEFDAGILADWAWLGFAGGSRPRRQSEHLDEYRATLSRLRAMGMVYPCFCSRRQVNAEAVASARAPHGPLGVIYSGACRRLGEAARSARIAAAHPHVWRLDAAAAAAQVGALRWREHGGDEILVDPLLGGDVVLARRDVPTSYHLAVVHDDHAQGVNLVTRGEDLRDATHVHRVLQALLGHDAPDYAHHPLLLDADGRRFAKRDRALTVAALRAAGHSPDAVIAMAQQWPRSGPRSDG